MSTTRTVDEGSSPLRSAPGSLPRSLVPLVGAASSPGGEPRASTGQCDLTNTIRFSVLISVYKADDPDFFDQALHSVTTHQTLPPDEVVLVVDGPVPVDLNRVVDDWEKHNEFRVKVVRSPQNVGLAKALNLGLRHCSHEYVVRMDSDDISVPSRFQIQFDHLRSNRDVALLGAWYRQYDKDLEQLLTDRKVPTEMSRIVGYAKTRTPFNHVTAVFEKAAVLNVGGYPDIDGYVEDWWVALRLIKHGYKLENLPEYLVDVRGDREFIGRRGGLAYLKTEVKNLSAMRQQGLISGTDLTKNLAIRVLVRILPLRLRTWAYLAIRRV